MPIAGETDAPKAQPTIFLSYASEDRASALLIRDALAAAGLEVWFDENELGGGDAWDQKLRRQIRECDYFMPIVSARTEARREGYFRREWRLAVERTLDMADDHTFLLPVVIDSTDQSTASVPERFLAVQWTKVAGGHTTPAFVALCARLVSGKPLAVQSRKRAVISRNRDQTAPFPAELPVFPNEEPGQRVKFWVHVIEWACRTAWILFNRIPKILRLVVYAWLAISVLSVGRCHRTITNPSISTEAAEKMKAIAEKYKGDSSKEAAAKLGIDIAREFSKEIDGSSAGENPLLVIPFGGTTEGSDPTKFANSTFGLVYGRLVISRQGEISLGKEPLPPIDAAGARDRGRLRHARLVLFGGIDPKAAEPMLVIELLEVSNGTVTWSKSYPVAGSDSEKIAEEVQSAIPALGDDT